MRRARCLLAAFLCSLVFASTLSFPAHADWLWDQHRRADALEQAGNMNEALPLWLQLAEGYARLGNWTNAAIYWKKRGLALDAAGRRDEAIQAFENEAYFWTMAGHTDWGQEDLIRADALRSTIRLFAKREGSASTSGALGKFEPASGSYLGVYSELDPAVVSFPDKAAQEYGRPHAAFLVYSTYGLTYPGGTYLPQTWLQRAKEAGATLQLHLQPLGGLDEVRDDAYLRALARELKETEIPIFLRFAGEMNGDWVPWYGDPVTYIEKWKIVTQVMRGEAPNVAMVWAPNHVPAFNIDEYYPGDEWVDWVGISMYQDYYASGLAAYPADRESPLDKVRGIYERYAERKPIMIAEWGAANREYTYGTDVTEWGALQIQRFYGAIQMLYPRVKAIFYFSVDQQKTPSPLFPTSVWSSYLLSDKQPIRDAYRSATAAPYFLTSVGQAGERSAPSRYDELTDFAAVRAGEERLESFVKIYDPFISRVEYRLEGEAPVVSTAFPYPFVYNFAPHAGQTRKLEILAYNRDGQLEGRKTVRLVVGEQASGSALVDMPGHWANDLVSRMVSYGIINGYPDATFRPDEPISREAFVKLVATALGLDDVMGGIPSFTDVAADRWSYPQIEAAVAKGVLVPGEYDGQRFNPEGAISRTEVAVILVRALGLWKEAEFEQRAVPFGDAGAIPENRRGYAALAAELGLMGGLPDGRFAGADPATRAQAAVVVARLLDAR